MEFPRRGQSSQTPDGDGGDDGRRFPDSTPPNAREPSPAAAQGDAVEAALARRREELMWELHKTKIRREMLLCDLVETERAMAARFAAARHTPTPATPPLPWPQGDLLPPAPAAREYAWRGAPWEEQAHGALAARSGDQETTPWWRRSPSAVRTPVYPHVEHSPSPLMPWGRPADDDERQECSGPSGSPAMAPPVQPAPNVEHSTPLPSKEPEAVAVAEVEAVVQTGASADDDQALLSQGAIPGGRGVIGQEGDEGEIAIDVHARQLLGESTVSKSCEQPKPMESITGGQTDEHVQQGCQDKSASQEIAALEEQKRVELNNELTPERKFAGVKRQLTAGTLLAKKPRPQQNYNCSLCKVSVTSPLEMVKHRASLLHHYNLAPLQAGNKTTAVMTTTMTTATEAVQHEKKTEKPELSECNSSAYHYQAKCKPEFHFQKHLHLGGRMNRGNMATLQPHAGGGSKEEEACRRAGASDRADAADPGRKTANQTWLYFCEVCNVRSNSEKVMESHLAGKRHREMVQGRS